jgi:hypothetical protein
MGFYLRRYFMKTFLTLNCSILNTDNYSLFWNPTKVILKEESMDKKREKRNNSPQESLEKREDKCRYLRGIWLNHLAGRGSTCICPAESWDCSGTPEGQGVGQDWTQRKTEHLKGPSRPAICLAHLRTDGIRKYTVESEGLWTGPPRNNWGVNELPYWIQEN